jgi:hypothetical protein
MDERSTKVSELLHEAAETHHQVYRITDGADDDWASWYAQWQVTLSELPAVIPPSSALGRGTHPAREDIDAGVDGPLDVGINRLGRRGIGV